MLRKYILAQIKEWIQRNSFISTTMDCEGNTILGESGAKKKKKPSEAQELV